MEIGISLRRQPSRNLNPKKKEPVKLAMALPETESVLYSPAVEAASLSGINAEVNRHTYKPEVNNASRKKAMAMSGVLVIFALCLSPAAFA